MRWNSTLPRLVLVCAIVIGLISCGSASAAIEFQAGQLEGIPAYPGGAQITGNLNLDVPPRMREFIGDSGSWSAYRTGDAIEDIAFFYLREMELRGYTTSEMGGPGVLAWTDGNDRYAVHIVIQRVQNNIILASTR